MSIEVKLVRGGESLTISSSPYAVGVDFAPPAINASYAVGAGTSANRMGGGGLIGRRANNRMWSFTVRILGSGLSEAHAYARTLERFIKLQSAETLWLEYRENAGVPVPLWGQTGAPLRYEIVRGDVLQPSEAYIKTQKGFFVGLNLEIRPLAVGQRQRLMSVTGGVAETRDGLRMAPDGTNKMSNPTFGHATWLNEWFVGTSVRAERSTDARYLLPGQLASAKCTCVATSNYLVYQQINVGNTNAHSFSAYVMRPDLGTVSSNDCVIFYDGAARATTFQNMGSGLWLAYSDNIAGVASVKSTGIKMLSGRTVYLLGYQCEEAAQHTELISGDMMGCAWSGTAHASTSTRTGSYCTMQQADTIYNLAQGAIAITVKPAYASGNQTMPYIFSISDSALSGLALEINWNNATGKFGVYTTTNTVVTTAVSWAAGDTVHLVVSYGPVGGMVIYVNGVDRTAVPAAYVPDILSRYQLMILGSSRFKTYQFAGYFSGFDIFEGEVSADTALTMYQAQSAAVAAGMRVGAIPFWYTVDGTDILKNCDDTLHHNWGVAGGIAGSEDAETEWRLAVSDASLAAHWLMQAESGRWVSPTAPQAYFEIGGTADANASGSAYLAVGDGGAFGALGEVYRPDWIDGRIHFFARVGYNGGAGTLTMIPNVGNSMGNYASPGTTTIVTPGTAYTWYYLGDSTYHYDAFLTPSERRLNLQLTGSNWGGTAKLDYYMAINGHVAKIDNSGGSAVGSSIILQGARAVGTDGTRILKNYGVYGDEIHLHPGFQNTIWYVGAGDRGVHDIEATAQFSVTILPRYGLV